MILTLEANVGIGHSIAAFKGVLSMSSGLFRRFRLGVSALMFGILLVGVIAVPVSARAASKGLFKIGFICGCSGDEASSIAVSSGVMQAWASYENAHGGIEGQKVDVIVKDDAGNPITSVSE